MTLITILLSILKIAIYTILSVLAAALILLSVVLFWEFKYSIICDISDHAALDARVTWIFKIFRLKITYNNDGFKADLRALWFKVMPKLKDTATKEADSVKEVKRGTKSKSKPKNEPKSEQKPKTEPKPESKPEHQAKDSGQEKTENRRRTRKESASERTKKEGEPPKNIFSRIKEKRDNIFYIINHPDRDIIIKNSLKLLSRLRRGLKKCGLKIYGELGFEDPSLTGKALGAAAAISGIIGIDTALKGNFEHEAFDVRIESRGKIMIWSLLWPLAVFIFSKPVWKLVKKILFGKEED